jgi:hypothetical protein
MHVLVGCKTTACLLNIYFIREKCLLKKNQAFVFVTHTNVAIVILLKRKWAEKANRMFCHPNFFGTIQSFVYRYLAIPAYIKCCLIEPNYIDTEIQKERICQSI